MGENYCELTLVYITVYSYAPMSFGKCQVYTQGNGNISNERTQIIYILWRTLSFFCTPHTYQNKMVADDDFMRILLNRTCKF